MKGLLLNIINLFLLFAFVVGLSVQSVIVLNFHLHQKQIAEEKCINKSRPELHCEGHCYLNQKLEETSKEKEAQSPKIIEDFEVTAILSDEKIEISENNDVKDHQIKIAYNNLYSFLTGMEVYHPPQSML